MSGQTSKIKAYLTSSGVKNNERDYNTLYGT